MSAMVQDSSSQRTAQEDSWEEEPKSIYRLVAAKNWSVLRKKLQSKPCTTTTNSKYFRPILHFVCRFHPPLDIVELLSEKFPLSLKAVDKKTKRYPIHVAAEFGAPCDVIQYLAESDPILAGTQDVTGMTPIHLLCKYYAARHHPKSEHDRRCTNECMIDAIKALIRTASASLVLEDVNGMNAIEVAIMSEVDFRIVHALQKACEKQCKINAQNSGGREVNIIDMEDANLSNMARRFANCNDNIKTMESVDEGLHLLFPRVTRPEISRARAA